MEYFLQKNFFFKNLSLALSLTGRDGCFILFGLFPLQNIHRATSSPKHRSALFSFGFFLDSFFRIICMITSRWSLDYFILFKEMRDQTPPIPMRGSFCFQFILCYVFFFILNFIGRLSFFFFRYCSSPDQILYFLDLLRG